MDKLILEKLKKYNPKSIFVYGSKATNSCNSKSDYEIGVIFDEKNYVSKTKINNDIKNKNFSIFPFRYNELINYDIDTPFEKNIYIGSLICGGAKTIYGEQIIENLPFPNISYLDLLFDSHFSLGKALCSYKIFKAGNISLSCELLYKSVFFATRNLIYSKTKKLVVEYNNIYAESKKLDIPDEYKKLLDISFDLRNEKINQCEEMFYFKAISYINKFIIPTIKNSPF